MLLPKQCRFVGCEKASAVVEAEKPSTALTYETQLWKNDSDIIASKYVLSSAKVYKEAMKRFIVRKCLDT